MESGIDKNETPGTRVWKTYCIYECAEISACEGERYLMTPITFLVQSFEKSKMPTNPR